MSVQVWTYIIVGITFALYIGIAIWSRAGSTKDFYVAGGGVSPLANGMATAADWMSAASFISMAGIISFTGYDGSVYLMGWTGGYVLLALLLAPYLRKFGKFTVPDFIGAAFSDTADPAFAASCVPVTALSCVTGCGVDGVSAPVVVMAARSPVTVSPACDVSGFCAASADASWSSAPIIPVETVSSVAARLVVWSADSV